MDCIGYITMKMRSDEVYRVVGRYREKGFKVARKPTLVRVKDGWDTVFLARRASEQMNEWTCDFYEKAQ